MSGLVGLRLKERLRLPLVVTFHALGLVRREHPGAADGFPPERIDIEHRLVQCADRLVAECPQDRADLLRLYGADDERIDTVPCGVDLHEFSPGSKARARRELALSDDEFVVLQLGRMVPRKGVDNVIHAVARMAPMPGAPVRLLIVGGESEQPDERVTPEIGRLRQVARECGVGELGPGGRGVDDPGVGQRGVREHGIGGCVDAARVDAGCGTDARVTFLGQRQRAALRNCYLAADVFVSTPWYEPFGITPLEAMACGRPVVGSDVGGIAYSVVHEVTGFLVPPHDPEALARRLEQLRANPALAQALGRAGARRVRSRFTWAQVTRELVEVYDRARAAATAAATEPTLKLVDNGMVSKARVAGRLASVRW